MIDPNNDFETLTDDQLFNVWISVLEACDEMENAADNLPEQPAGLAEALRFAMEEFRAFAEHVVYALDIEFTNRGLTVESIIQPDATGDDQEHVVYALKSTKPEPDTSAFSAFVESLDIDENESEASHGDE